MRIEACREHLHTVDHLRSLGVGGGGGADATRVINDDQFVCCAIYATIAKDKVGAAQRQKVANDDDHDDAGNGD